MWIYSGLIPKLPTCDIEDLPDCSKSLCPAFLSSWFLQWIHNCFQGAWFFLFTVFFSLYNCGLFQWLVCYALLTLSSTLEVICHIGSKWVWCPDLLALSHSLFTGIILLLSDKADQTCNPETSGFFSFFSWYGLGLVMRALWEHLPHCCVCMKNTTSRPHELENKFQKGIFALRVFPKDTETN